MGKQVKMTLSDWEMAKLSALAEEGETLQGTLHRVLAQGMRLAATGSGEAWDSTFAGFLSADGASMLSHALPALFDALASVSDALGAPTSAFADWCAQARPDEVSRAFGGGAVERAARRAGVPAVRPAERRRGPEPFEEFEDRDPFDD